MPTFLDNLTEYNAKASLAISQAVADGNLPKANMMSSLKTTANDTTLSEEIRLNALTALINLGSLLTIPLPPYFPVVTTFPDTQVYVGLHNELSGLQGGQAGEYYHLTQAQWTAIGSAATAADISFENLQGVYTDNASLVSGFDSKQDVISAPGLGTYFLKINGNTISFDNNSYLSTISGIAAGGELTGTYPAPLLSNAAVIGKVLTGWNGSATYSAITASDSILSGMEKLNARISQLIANPGGVASVQATTNVGSIFTMSPSTPLPGAVTVGVSWSSQSINTFLAAPSSTNGTPSFRLIVNDDLPLSGVSAGTYGSTSLIPVVTVNDKGIVTSISTASNAAGGQVDSVTFQGPGGVFLDTNAGTATDPIVGFTLDNVSVNTVWAGPASGGASIPGFRSLVLADIAGISIPQSQIDNLTETLSTFLTGSLANSTMYIGNVSDAAVNATATGDLSLTYVDNNGTNEAQFTINNGVVSYAKIQNVTAQTLLGRYSLTNGTIQELTLDPSDFTINNTTGVIGLVTPNPPTLTTKGDLLTSNGTSQVRLGIGANATIFMADTAASTGNKWVAMSGDVSIATSGATTIANNAVTFAKMQTIADGRILGNNSGGTAVPSELTGATVTTLLSQFDTTSTAQGVVPGSNNLGSTYFLDGSGNWSQPAGSGTIYSAAQYSIPYYSDSPTGIALSGLAPQTTNGVYFLRANVTASAAVAPDWIGSTGSGSVVLATSPTLVTPNIGVATATSVNGLTITATTGTLTLASGSILATAGAFSTTLTATGATNVTLPTTGTLATLAGIETLSNKTLLSPQIGDSATNGHAHFRKAGAAIPPGFSNYATMWFPETGGNKRMAIMWDNVGYASEFQLNATASQTYTFQDATGTVALIDASNVLNVPKSGGTSGAIALGGGTSGTITLQAPATVTAGQDVYTLPSTYPGAASGWFLTSNLSGGLSWVSVTGGGDVTSTATGTPQGNFAVFDSNTGKVINTSSVASLGASPSGRATFNNGVNVGVASLATGTLTFAHTSTAFTTTISQPGTASTNATYFWPTSSGSVSNVLTLGASGQLAWSAAGSGDVTRAGVSQVITGSIIYQPNALQVRNTAQDRIVRLQALATGGAIGTWDASFQAASGTVPLLEQVQSFTAAQTFTGGVTVSTAALTVNSAATFDGTGGTITFSRAASSGSAITISGQGTAITPQVVFSGATMNWMNFGTTGQNPPAHTGVTGSGRSSGTKIVILQNNVASGLDNAIGIESLGMWLSGSSAIRFYPNSSLFSAGQWEYSSNVRGLNLNAASDTNITFPQLLIGGAGTNAQWISFGAGNSGAPAFTTGGVVRSAGTKIVVYQSVSASALDSAIGFDSSQGLWLSSSGSIAFYTNNSTTARATISSSGLVLNQAGSGILIKEGTNATMGQATLVAGTVTVSTTKVTANSRIMLTAQNNSGTEYGIVKVSARAASTSFTITSYRGNNTTTVATGDTSNVAWQIIEPAP